jgi:hypothetical protein
MARDIFAKPYDKDCLTLKRASASRPSGRWSDDDFDVRSNGTVVGRILKIHAAPVRKPLDVDVSHRASRRPLTGARLRADARSCGAGVRSWRGE